MTPFEALVEESEKVGWPLAYRNDLFVHDRAILEGEDPPDRFVWVLRDAGTHIIRPDKKCGERVPASLFLRAILRTDGDACRFYIWDGKELRRASTDECEAAMAYRGENNEPR